MSGAEGTCLGPGTRALEGTTVLDLTAGVSGPLCTRLLGDWGARVIKVEPAKGDFAREWDTVCGGMSAAFVWLNRNKESVVLDLKTPEGRQAVVDLAGRADVLVENFSPGVMERLGFAAGVLRRARRDLIACHVTGYGEEGRYAGMKAFDMLIQGEAGVLAMTGTPEAMAKVPLSICDIGAGMYAAAAICAALHRRDRTGEGEDLRVAMFDCMMDWLGYFPYFYWHRGQEPARLGVKHHLLTPYGPYRAADGRFVNLAVLSQEHWRRFCRHVLERPDLLDDPRFATNEVRIANRQAIEDEIERAVRQRPQAEWIERLTAQGIPCGRVNTLAEVLDHPRLAASGQVKRMATPRGPLPTMDNPVRWAAADNRLESPPELGAHTASVLAELGYPPERLAALTRPIPERGEP